MAAAKKNKPHYVDNKKLYAAMIEYHKELVALREAHDGEGEAPKPQIPEYVGECILNISTRLALRPNFIGYTYRDDMVGDGIENCLTYIHNYDPNKYNNPFAYFTKIIWFAFLRRMDKEKKQTYIKHKSLEMHSYLLENEPDGKQMQQQINIDGRLDDLINHFEKKKPPAPKKKKIDKFIEKE